MNDQWQLLSREFSRVWRRGKIYRLSEIKLLARRRRLVLRPVGRNHDAVEVVDGSKPVARFQRVSQTEVTEIGRSPAGIPKTA